MDSDAVARLEAVRGHHLGRVNDAIRRPGSYGGEVSLQLLLEAAAAVDDRQDRWEEEFEALRGRGASTPTGVTGAYGSVLPEDARRDAVASVYAEIAHRLGWLRLDRVLSAAELAELADRVDDWARRDRTLQAVIDAFGEPSVWIGGTNPRFGKTLVYATGSGTDGVVCFHLWNAIVATPPGVASPPVGVYPEPVLLAVRHRPGDFHDAFTLTPQGLDRRPAAGRATQPEGRVWIFHGVRARYAAGVFTNLRGALAWAAKHHLTGTLTEYRVGGAYDIALQEGRFTPTRPHHGSADHVSGFSPGLRHLHLVDGYPDA